MTTTDIAEALDKLIVMYLAQSIVPEDMLSDSGREMRRLERLTVNADVCRKEWHGTRCQRMLGHAGSCAAAITF